MKLISSSSKTPLRPPSRPHRGWFLRRLRSRVFSARAAWWVLVAIAAWWVLVAIVAAFAISIFRMLRHALEANLQ